MTTEQKKEALENLLKNSGNFPDKYSIHAMNKGRNAKFIIVSKNHLGGIDTHTKAMNYDEMNGYLFGHIDAQKNILKP